MLERGERISFLPSPSSACWCGGICGINGGEVNCVLWLLFFPHQRLGVKKEEYLLDA